MDVVRTLTHDQVHARAIDKVFAGNVRYTGDEPVFDTPIVVLLFSNRSGSNLAASYLKNTGLIGGLLECTNHPFAESRKKKFRLKSFPDLLIREANAVVGSKRWFGIKASPSQIAMLYRWNCLSIFSGVKVIHSVRQDVLSQAVSMVIALQTNKWISRGEHERRDVDYDFSQIAHHLKRINAQNTAARLICNALDLRAHEIVYEELVADPQREICAAIESLGLPTDGIGVGKPDLQKQADATNERFKERFRADIRDAIMTS